MSKYINPWTIRNVHTFLNSCKLNVNCITHAIILPKRLHIEFNPKFTPQIVCKLSFTQIKGTKANNLN